jgi:hypothetical protein
MTKGGQGGQGLPRFADALMLRFGALSVKNGAQIKSRRPILVVGRCDSLSTGTPPQSVAGARRVEWLPAGDGADGGSGKNFFGLGAVAGANVAREFWPRHRRRDRQIDFHCFRRHT